MQESRKPFEDLEQSLASLTTATEEYENLTRKKVDTILRLDIARATKVLSIYARHAKALQAALRSGPEELRGKLELWQFAEGFMDELGNLWSRSTGSRNPYATLLFAPGGKLFLDPNNYADYRRYYREYYSHDAGKRAIEKIDEISAYFRGQNESLSKELESLARELEELSKQGF